jgi:hypothetical protein
MGYRRNGQKVLVGKAEGKRPVGRRSQLWADNMLLKWILEIVGLIWHKLTTTDGLLGIQ